MIGLWLCVGCGLETQGGGGAAQDPDGSSGGASAVDAAFNLGGHAGAGASAGANADAGTDTDAAVGGAAGSSGGGAGTGGGGALEVCNNNKDDDGDGKVDCEDSDCSPTHLCVPNVPGGWTGPVVLAEEVSAPAACSAQGGQPNQTFEGGTISDVPPLSCPSCVCNAGSSSCADPKITSYSEKGCSKEVANATVTGCAQLSGNTTQNSYKLTAGKASGSCAAGTLGTEVRVPPTLSAHARACGGGTLGAGCSGGKCVAKGTGSYNRYCIQRGGDQACPTAFPKKTTFSSWKDQRTCAACTCGSVQCEHTGAAFDNYSGGQCSGSLGVTSAGACTDLPGGENSMGVLTTTTAACAPSGGGVTGSLTETAVTFCCL